MNEESEGINARLVVQRRTFTLDVDLQLPGSGFIALFGPSGCGKTTCLRALAGLERANPGLVRVAGTTWQDDTAGIWLPTHQRRQPSRQAVLPRWVAGNQPQDLLSTQIAYLCLFRMVEKRRSKRTQRQRGGMPFHRGHHQNQAQLDVSPRIQAGL